MSCPVCLEPYKDPVVLPCGHTFCRGSCAQRLIRNDCLKCPTCRTTHWVPEGEEGLPRNYALQDILDRPERDPSPSTPNCQDHPEDAVNMFCTQCYKLVCLRCCLGQMVGDTPRHFQHEVIAIDRANDYVQNVLAAASDYVKSRKDEEMTLFENLAVANEQLQERLHQGCSSIQREERRLKRLVEDRSNLLIGQLHSFCCASNIPDQSQNSLSKVLEYNALINHCDELSARNKQESASDNWKKCEDLGRLLQCIDNMAASSNRPCPRQTLTAQMVQLNTDHAQTAIETTLTFNTDFPSAPVFRPEDCVISENSASLTWSFRPEEKIIYFTFYFETAIYSNGMCKDLQSFDVTDFGRCTAQTTIRGLERGKRYRAYVLARNDVGESSRSNYLYFKAVSGDCEAKII